MPVAGIRLAFLMLSMTRLAFLISKATVSSATSRCISLPQYKLYGFVEGKQREREREREREKERDRGGRAKRESERGRAREGER
jgi:hypothetical protein